MGDVTAFTGAAHWIKGGGPTGCGVLLHRASCEALGCTSDVVADELEKVLPDDSCVVGVWSVVVFPMDDGMPDHLVISPSVACSISFRTAAVDFLLAPLRLEEGFRPPVGSPC